MIQENEIVMLMLGIGVMVFVLLNRSRLKKIPFSGIIITAFYVVLAGWGLTVLEGFFWGDILNFIEHLCYIASAVLMLAWCWKVFVKTESGKNA